MTQLIHQASITNHLINLIAMTSFIILIESNVYLIILNLEINLNLLFTINSFGVYVNKWPDKFIECLRQMTQLIYQASMTNYPVNSIVMTSFIIWIESNTCSIILNLEINLMKILPKSTYTCQISFIILKNTRYKFTYLAS